MEKKIDTLAIVVSNEGKVATEEAEVLEEIAIEELSIDGVCGVY